MQKKYFLLTNCNLFGLYGYLICTFWGILVNITKNEYV